MKSLKFHNNTETCTPESYDYFRTYIFQIFINILFETVYNTSVGSVKMFKLPIYLNVVNFLYKTRLLDNSHFPLAVQTVFEYFKQWLFFQNFWSLLSFCGCLRTLLKRSIPNCFSDKKKQSNWWTNSLVGFAVIAPQHRILSPVYILVQMVFHGFQPSEHRQCTIDSISRVNRPTNWISILLLEC